MENGLISLMRRNFRHFPVPRGMREDIFYDNP